MLTKEDWLTVLVAIISLLAPVGFWRYKTTGEDNMRREQATCSAWARELDAGLKHNREAFESKCL